MQKKTTFLQILERLCLYYKIFYTKFSDNCVFKQGNLVFAVQQAEYCANECSLIQIYKEINDVEKCAARCANNNLCRGFNLRNFKGNTFECRLLSYLPGNNYSKYISKIEDCWFFYLVYFF